jgi:hypothetical protein
MQFFALVSITFYIQVMLIYLILGHSHNTADQIITWCRNAIDEGQKLLHSNGYRQGR